MAPHTVENTYTAAAPTTNAKSLTLGDAGAEKRDAFVDHKCLRQRLDIHSQAQGLEAYLHEAYSLSAISGDLADPLKHFVVACNDQGLVVGFAQLTQGTRLSQSGVGKRLIQHVEDIARTQGFKTMWLGVWEENYKAQKVYERSGYGKVGDQDFKMGDCIQTDFIMSKPL